MIAAAPDLTAPAPQAAPEPPDPAAALLARQQAMLAELAEIAMEVARAVARQAAEGPAVERGVDLTLAVARASRAVRLTLMLQTRLLCPSADGAGGGKDGGGPARSVESRKAEAHALIEHFVKDEHGDDEAAVERLMTEAVDRLEVEQDVLGRPLGEIVGLICNDLQLSPWRVEQAMLLFDNGHDLAGLIEGARRSNAPAGSPPPEPPPDMGWTAPPPRLHRGHPMPPARPYPRRAPPPPGPAPPPWPG